MVEPTMETLARRLDRVERENRRLKQAGVVGLAVIAAVVLMGQATESKGAKVIEAEKFVVKDRDGKIRAELGLSGGVFSEGRMILKPDVPHLSFYDEQSTPHIRLKFDRGTAKFLLGDKKRGHALLLVDEQGFAGLDLYAMGERKQSVSMAAFLTETRLSLSDKAGQHRIQFWGDRTQMILRGKDGQGELEANPSNLRIHDRDGKGRAVLGSTTLKITRPGRAGGKVETEEKRPESSLVLFDKKGNVIWKAP